MAKDSKKMFGNFSKKSISKYYHKIVAQASSIREIELKEIQFGNANFIVTRFIFI